MELQSERTYPSRRIYDERAEAPTVWSLVEWRESKREMGGEGEGGGEEEEGEQKRRESVCGICVCLGEGGREERERRGEYAKKKRWTNKRRRRVKDDELKVEFSNDGS